VNGSSLPRLTIPLPPPRAEVIEHARNCLRLAQEAHGEHREDGLLLEWLDQVEKELGKWWPQPRAS
jgi:hypothetical protein